MFEKFFPLSNGIFTRQQEERSMTLYFYDNTQSSLNL